MLTPFFCIYQVIAKYFPLSQCLKGLNVLVESLFGATFHQIPMRDGESWHPDVIKLSLCHPDEVQAWQSCFSMTFLQQT
jgi:intermediate peptidase